VDSRRGQLALTLQEALTAAVRLRANRQVASDAASFRNHIKQLLSEADARARKAGYGSDTVKLAIYAYIVFLDESVLNSAQPMFAEWPRKPLQEEVFGGHMGGEIFFQYLHELLGRQDSEELADLLEVYLLCLLLGFEGRYSVAGRGELQGLISSVMEKVQRCRGGFGGLSPAWAPPPDESAPVHRDPWLRWLGYATALFLSVALVLFIIFDLALRSGLRDLQGLAP
jgi:type VI secretion system protein ImpK